MPNLGSLAVPVIATSGTYPLKPDNPLTCEIPAQVAVHRFGNKTEQRYYLGGAGLTRYRVVHNVLTRSKRASLATFWTQRQGAYGQFTFAAPQPDGTTANVTVRFANPEISFQGLISSLERTGVEMIEVPAAGASYGLAATVTRFPGSLASALLSQAQTIIPLVKIQPVEAGYPAIYISDRDVTVGGQLYQARLLKLPAVSQATGGKSDAVRLELGNGDRILTQLAQVVDLRRASIEISLFHAGSETKLDFWKGEVTRWHSKPGNPVFRLEASDGLYELTLPYPERRVTRECSKEFNDGGACPFATQGTTHSSRTLTKSDKSTELFNFAPSGSSCDKGWETPNGCLAHGMERYFGGVVAKPQTVRTKDNSTGLKGLGRDILATSSQLADSVYDGALQQVYCNVTDEDESKGLRVKAALVSGRDEGDFYTALGIVGAGPIGEFAAPSSTLPYLEPDAQPPFLLDGQPHHGWTAKGLNPRSRFGLRLGHGHDPVQNNDPDSDSDKFSLGEGGEGPQRWDQAKHAAGIAIAEIRRSDTKGLQLSRLSEHSMEVTVRKGMSGWVWTGAGARALTPGITNPIWMCVNFILRAKGVFLADAATQEQFFDMDACLAAAAICDINAAKLIGEGSEKQFEFVGVVGEERPLREWLEIVLNSCLGDYWFCFGKFYPFIRVNSSVAQAFSAGNTLWDSLEIEPRQPEFNHLTASIADEEFDYVGNAVVYYDINHAKFVGAGTRVQYLKKSFPLNGVTTKSRAARIATTRTREELGGTSAAHYRYHSQIAIGSTVLALTAAPGMICSMTHEDLPTYPAAASGQVAQAGYAEFRVERIQLHDDYSVSIEGPTTHDDMYDLTHGPKPADVEAEPLPTEDEFAPADWHYDVLTDHDGGVTFQNFSVGSYGDAVHQGTFDVYYVDEREGAFSTMFSTVNAAATSISIFGVQPSPGDYILCNSEIMLVEAISSGTATVKRGQLGTTAASHGRTSTTVSSVLGAWRCQLVVASGLAGVKPGQQLVAPNSAQSAIVEYNTATGLLRTALPITDIGAGQTVYTDPRIHILRTLNVTIPFAPRFFRSAQRATFSHPIKLEYAGVAVVVGQLENTRGLKSEIEYRGFTAAFPHRLRTGGTMTFSFPHPELPTGEVTDTCIAITAPESQPFELAYAEILRGDTGPLAAPRAPGRATPAGYAAAGSITFSGTVRAGVHIGVTLSGRNNMRAATFIGSENGIADNAALTLLADKVATWLNADPQFAAFYKATPSGAAVSVTDHSGAGGTLACDIAGAGGTTAVVTGLSAGLGIVRGRRYLCAFTGGGYRSDLGELSKSTSPTGSAARVELADIPVSPDSRVTGVEIYALPDGADSSAAARLIAGVGNGTTTAVDTVTEAALAGASPYPGATQPALGGDIITTVKRDGHPWVELRIPDGQSRSNEVEGLALSPVSPGAVLSIDTSNDSGVTPEFKAVLA